MTLTPPGVADCRTEHNDNQLIRCFSMFFSSTRTLLGCPARRLIARMSTDPKTYIFNHTMFRITDPKVSIPWYEKVLGMECFRECL